MNPDDMHGNTAPAPGAPACRKRRWGLCGALLLIAAAIACRLWRPNRLSDFERQLVGVWQLDRPVGSRQSDLLILLADRRSFFARRDTMTSETEPNLKQFWSGGGGSLRFTLSRNFPAESRWWERVDWNAKYLFSSVLYPSAGNLPVRQISANELRVEFPRPSERHRILTRLDDTELLRHWQSVADNSDD